MNVSMLATWHILQGFTLQLNRPSERYEEEHSARQR